MSRGGLCAARRTKAIAQHMMSTAASASEPSVKFESNRALRTYILNRPTKLNALDESMLSLLRPKIEEWSSSDLCGTILGTGVGRAFCAGGDIANVVLNASDPNLRHQAIDFFKREFEMDYILAALSKPYVVLLDGFTMGGGVGLAAHAPFRIATENTTFAMPETKIGYCPDVGASYFLSRLDGELGTYFALTSDIIRGRAVFEHGFATHFIPARRIPTLIERLAALEDPHPTAIDQAIEELVSEREPSEPPLAMSGLMREALDFAFRHNSIEAIFEDLRKFSEHHDSQVRSWAKQTLETLEFRSPTSLKVALSAIRQGRSMTLLEALNMELKIATAYCNGASPDFPTGVNAVLGGGKEKKDERPNWSPSTVDGVTDEIVSRFFEGSSSFLSNVPTLDIPEVFAKKISLQPMKFGLPTEEEIGTVVRGEHKTGGTMGMTLDELVGKFGNLRPGKLGVKEKILEVASRRCEIVDNADGNFVWLKWKSAPTQ
ncbi:3-hydroxyisobutyryl-CoA hydrolase [Pluteus cervinus]|uniref:3-hydroxyisobutyryl-CoA hydrolase n=1 Tax=Pluteus cervinus TaxID=181527 RepID=A0ACD3BE88_9AGAR|nr:3-hydroxyisobutyryl-CoA hydrolase [Pluteus cervinus]